MSGVGVVVANLGTPKDPSTREVGAYLREFLFDPCVIDIPTPFRWVLVNLIIVPFRSRISAKMYRKIWTQDGSPLLVHSERLVAQLQESMPPPFEVKLAMRYGQPSLASVIKELHHRGIRKLILCPQYPQYALSTVESTVREARRVIGTLTPQPSLSVLPPFYEDPGFLDITAGNIKSALEGEPADHVVMSFHSVPTSHITAEGFGGPSCFKSDQCCGQIDSQNANCYRAQCFATARGLAQRAGLGEDHYTVAFQSRLKGPKWISPFTDVVLGDLASRGVKRVSVVCPSFTVDCLETLEEVAQRYGRDFHEAGGGSLHLIPCLNHNPAWTQRLGTMIQEFARNNGVL